MDGNLPLPINLILACFLEHEPICDSSSHRTVLETFLRSFRRRTHHRGWGRFWDLNYSLDALQAWKRWAPTLYFRSRDKIASWSLTKQWPVICCKTSGVVIYYPWVVDFLISWLAWGCTRVAKKVPLERKNRDMRNRKRTEEAITKWIMAFEV